MILARIKRLFTIEHFVLPSRIGGTSSDQLYEQYQSFINPHLMALASNPPPGTTIATTPSQLQAVLKILMEQTKGQIVTWDTETVDLDIKRETPIGLGRVICLSAFAGPHVDFGNGSRLFIDNFGVNSVNIHILKQYFESEQHLKSFHNYGFDRHVIENHGIEFKGFAADTMHMARLFDPSMAPGQYSLSSLTDLYKLKIQQYREELIETLEKQFLDCPAQLQALQRYRKELLNQSLQKHSMDKLFRRKKILQNGHEGKTDVLPTTLTLHTHPEFVKDWVHYSALDAEAAFFLRVTLDKFLEIQKSSAWEGLPNMKKLYQEYWCPFGEVLTRMEKTGISVNKDHLQNIRQQAIQDLNFSKCKFIQFLSTFQDASIQNFNLGSIQQLQQLLFAPFERKDVSKVQTELDQQEDVETDPEIKTNTRTVKNIFPELAELKIPNPLGKPVQILIRIRGLGIQPLGLTMTGLPSVDANRLRQLAGTPSEGKYGKAYDHFKQKGCEQFGKDLCQALEHLLNYKQINTLLKTFIEPLMERVDPDGRIHCSLNLNTETGRISSRKPNLQNQPALEKDRYGIRKAFSAAPGCKLIVADYGQLELRVLAHLTNCKSMIDDFAKGGDFHSRTAVSMFPQLKKEIEQGKLLLEWKGTKDAKPDLPLLKEKYPTLRKIAKTMNFSIAYGKTAQGFAEEWNCSISEAKNSLDAWYRERKEVKQWQQQRKKIAEMRFYSQTLLGRYRFLHKFFRTPKMGMKFMGHRRAINTPVQGGAADIVVGAMIKIAYNQRLQSLGWKMLLQIHDEVILEGPQEQGEEALKLVKECMESPLERPLLVGLQVDAKIGDNWFECK